MAKKSTAKKISKASSKKSNARPRRPANASDSVSLSVTDGNMKEVIRAAFLRRNG